MPEPSSQSKIESLRRMQAARQQRKLNNAAATIQALVRGMIQRPKYRRTLQEQQEFVTMKQQIETLKLKLLNADEDREKAVREAEERITKSIGNSTDEDGIGSMELQQISIRARLDESEKVLDFLKRERKRLMGLVKTHKGRCERAEEQNKEFVDANEEIRSRKKELEQYMIVLENNKATLANNKDVYIQQMKQYKNEIQRGNAFRENEDEVRRLYQDAVERIVALVQEECKNDDVVEDIYLMALECEDATTASEKGKKGPNSTTDEDSESDYDYDGQLDDLADISDCGSVEAY